MKNLQKYTSSASATKTTNVFKDCLTKKQLDALLEKSKTDKLSKSERLQLVEEMSYYGCTLDDIATILNTTPYYLQNNYKAVLNRALVRWRYDLRKAQVTNAIKGTGNTTMLIWLGKQYLAQKDDPQLEVKRDKFDEFIEWMRQTTPSTEFHQNKATSS